MATREQYTTCMRPYMTGVGKTKEERQSGMCIGAKLCTGRAKDIDEAKRLCLEASSMPKEPKISRKFHRGKLDVNAVAACVIDKITDCNTLNTTALSNYFSDCMAAAGIKIKKPETKNRFLSKCVDEHRVNGTFAEGISLRKKCLVTWNEKQNRSENISNV